MEHHSDRGGMRRGTREHQGKGMCSVLIQEAVRYARSKKYRRIKIYCHRTNLAACRCYSKIFGDPVHVDPGNSAFELSLLP